MILIKYTYTFSQQVLIPEQNSSHWKIAAARPGFFEEWGIFMCGKYLFFLQNPQETKSHGKAEGCPENTRDKYTHDALGFL